MQMHNRIDLNAPTYTNKHTKKEKEREKKKMTNELKLQTLKAQEYADFLLEITEENGTIMVNCYHDNTKHDIEDIVVIEYNGVMIPVFKDNLNTYFAKCECCGEWIYLDNDDYIFCEDSENFFHNKYSCTNGWVTWCDYHERYEQEDNFYYVNTRYGEQWWCTYAVDDDAFYCDYNEQYYSQSDYESRSVYDELGNEFIWMQDFACDYAYWCERCENYFTYDAFDHIHDCCMDCVRDDEYDDCDECEDVYDVMINGYHHSKSNGTLTFHGESKYVNPVGTGFELEVDTDYQNATRNQAKLLRALKERFGDRITFERDGSLRNGFEIISAPHTKSEMDLVNWAELLQLCKEHGYKSHDYKTCGLHFHVSGYMFGATKEKQYDNIAKLIAFYEYYYNEFVKLSRRPDEWDYSAEHWANKFGVYYNGSMETYKNTITRIVKEYATGWTRERYRAINLTNVDYDTNLFKTVEFRINRGTLNAATFYASYDMIITLIKNAKKMDWNDSDFFNPKKWFKGCKANTYAYINKRNAFEGVFYMTQANNDTEYTQENA